MNLDCLLPNTGVPSLFISQKAQQIFLSYRETSPDALLFLLESCILMPVIHSEIPTSVLSPSFDNRYESYQSAFAFAEELIWGTLYDKPAVQVYYAALHNYYRLKLNAASLSGQENTMHILEQLEDIAREALRHRDMYAPLYLYLCYDGFLLLDGNSSKRANGYLSRAFKALHNSLGLLSDNNMRDAFILKNVWNAKLYAAAQKNTLV